MTRRQRAVAGARRTLRRIGHFVYRRGLQRSLRYRWERVTDRLFEIRHGKTRYEAWFGAEQRASVASRTEADDAGPEISIVMPVCDPDLRWLEAAIESIRNQVYSNWQLCVIDDASRDPAVAHALAEAAATDDRILVETNEQRRGISITSNRALSVATGEYVALLDHDDELTPDALMWVARSAREAPFDVLYSDEDKIDLAGRLQDPTFKPKRSRELLHSCMYFGHLCVYRRAFLDELGGFDAAFDGSQDYDLALRAEAQADRVVRLPRVLYHWRTAPGSAANVAVEGKSWAFAAGRRAIESEIDRRHPGADVRVVDGVARGFARVIRKPSRGATISIVYCSCCVSKDEMTGVRDSAVDAAGLSIEWVPMSRVPSQEPDAGIGSAGERWNQAARRASGQILIFVEGARPVSATPADGWVVELASQAARDDVGAVGVRIRSVRHELVHMGVVLGGAEVIRTRTPRMRSRDPGHLGLAQSIREVSAVTGGCLALRRDAWMEAGGFDAGYGSGLHDVDLCLRLGEQRARVLYDPFVEFELAQSHLGHRAAARPSLPEPPEADHQRLRARWRSKLTEDPFSSPNFHARGAVYHPCYRPATYA